MKISILIKKLEKIQKKNGDLDYYWIYPPDDDKFKIVIQDNDMGDKWIEINP